jgi:hypothetical protein
MRVPVLFASLALLAAAPSVSAEEKLAKVEVLPDKVAFTVRNPSPFVMRCTGQLVGTTRKGKRLVARMDGEEIQPGGDAALVLHSRDPKRDPFVDGWSDMACDAPNPEESP